MNTLYPIFLNLEHRPVLVVGGGEVAEQKIAGLLEADAEVRVIAPRVSATILHRAELGQIRLNLRPYAEGDVEGCFLVMAATDDPAVQRRVHEDARAKRIPVNVADVPALCSFYLSSVFCKGDLKIAVSTNGKSPALGQVIRDRIRDQFSDGYPGLIETLGQMRAHLKKELGDCRSRKEVLEGIVKTELGRLERYRETPERTVRGRVSLVGAGPGDPELITVRGMHALASAEVVLYDSLVSDRLLACAPWTSEKIFVGKKAGRACTPQHEINELMIARARAGKTVVRLKGGDPFVFGRGGEELEALQQAGIEVEIVPGVTAGTGVPASLGLPLTDRRCSSSVLFLTGHEDQAKADGHTGWAAAAHADTLVIYMGWKRLGDILARLAAHGVPATKPIAVVARGTLAGEQVVLGSLLDIEEKVKRVRIESPVLIVVGDVVHRLDLRLPEGISEKRHQHIQEEQSL